MCLVALCVCACVCVCDERTHFVWVCTFHSPADLSRSLYSTPSAGELMTELTCEGEDLAIDC